VNPSPKSRLLLTVFVGVLIVAAMAISARSQWTLEDSQGESILTRIDMGVNTPFHMKDTGVYARKDYYGLYWVVLNFNNSNPIQQPYTWTQVHWTPGWWDADSTH
jgi:hypothetical protein